MGRDAGVPAPECLCFQLQPVPSPEHLPTERDSTCPLPSVPSPWVPPSLKVDGVPLMMAVGEGAGQGVGISPRGTLLERVGQMLMTKPDPRRIHGGEGAQGGVS